MYRSKKVEKSAEELNELSRKVRSLEVNWIKAYVGHESNERADELARLAAKWDIIDEIAIPNSLVKHALYCELYEDLAEECQNDKTCRMTKEFMTRQNKALRKSILHYSISKMRRLL
jgi:hypothetical protein